MKYFTLKEFEYSDTAKLLHIKNQIPEEFIPHIEELVNTILDPLREAWGSGIIISSGYRCPKLNEAVHGSNTSAHCYGYAADLKPLNGKIEEFKTFCINWLKTTGIAFDQAINEYSGSASWMHIGIRKRSGEQRKEFLLYKNGKYSKLT